MADAKASSGQPFRPPPAEIWNGMVAAGEDYNERKRLASGGVPQPKVSPRDIIKIKNMTGAVRAKGSVFKIGAKVLTTIDREFAWFEGDEPEQTAHFAIARQSVADDKIVEAQVAGACIARVNVTNTSHMHAIVVGGDYELESAPFGPVDLIWTPASTGVAECLAVIRSPRTNNIIAKAPGGGISARSGTTPGSASCGLYYIDQGTGAITSLGYSHTVKHIGQVAVAANAYIQCAESFNVLVAHFEDCAG